MGLPYPNVNDGQYVPAIPDSVNKALTELAFTYTSLANMNGMMQAYMTNKTLDEAEKVKDSEIEQAKKTAAGELGAAITMGIGGSISMGFAANAVAELSSNNTKMISKQIKEAESYKTRVNSRNRQESRIEDQGTETNRLSPEQRAAKLDTLKSEKDFTKQGFKKDRDFINTLTNGEAEELSASVDKHIEELKNQKSALINDQKQADYLVELGRGASTVSDGIGKSIDAAMKVEASKSQGSATVKRAIQNAYTTQRDNFSQRSDSDLNAAKDPFQALVGLSQVQTAIRG